MLGMYQTRDYLLDVKELSGRVLKRRSGGQAAQVCICPPFPVPCVGGVSAMLHRWSVRGGTTAVMGPPGLCTKWVNL